MLARAEERKIRQTGAVPFPDEPFATRVDVLPYQRRWAQEGTDLVARLKDLLLGAAAVDHIGSTSVPGMPAKDCIDAMVRVQSLSNTDLHALVEAGFRERAEDWNREEALDGATYPKRVFAPPVGGRSMNVHVREVGSATARYSLLFRDFLRADANSRAVWGQFKVRLAETATDIYAYGQIKSTVQPLLMTLAGRWADDSSWQP